MTLDFDAPVFVVGGGTGGRVLAVARELVARGARVLLTGPELEPLEAAAEQLGDSAYACVADLADAADAARVGGVATALLGRVDGVLLDTGALPSGPVLDVADDQWLDAFDRSVRAPLALLRGIVPLLEGGGSVVFLLPAPAPGTASEVIEGSVAVLVACLRRELDAAIRVHTIRADELDEAAVLLIAAAGADDAVARP